MCSSTTSRELSSPARMAAASSEAERLVTARTGATVAVMGAE